MSENAAVTPDKTPAKTPAPGKGKGDKSAPTKPKMTAEEWTQNKIKKASDPDFNVISTKTNDVNELIPILNQLDFFTGKLRATFNRVGITAVQLEGLLQRADRAKLELNDVNAEMARLMGKEYRVPRVISSIRKALGQEDTNPVPPTATATASTAKSA